ncbi:protein FAR1-RELATED SEQUENCE 5-like [Papaver somniferum]|uniref:protein FAR1-RELATED SEQUENCE 5-like n=1 Tax=Papaver somniferum TaxID=3469 RepID=UPI000E7028D3|nr:protein FAR1-RELATED SEQUENCE 5-like [Papaver somniferum]
MVVQSLSRKRVDIESFEFKLFSDHLESTKETIGVEEREDEVVLDVVQCSSEEPINVVGFESTEYFTTNKTFNSKENVTEGCREIDSQYNIIVVIKKWVNKNENHGGKGYAIVLGCERGGKYRKRNCTVSPSKCRKGTATKKCGCPFKLRSTCVDASKWNLIVKDGHHNHAPADTLLGHSFAGRLSDEEKQFVIKFHEHGMPPRHILIALRENFKKNASTLKTIDNCIQKHRVSERAGRTRMQLLHKYLDDSHYVTWNRKNSDTCEVTDIFWAHPESTLCAQCFPSVVIINCTYKTNRWKMPLFHAEGMTFMGTTFSIAFAFMSAELTRNYEWALQHLRSLYSPTNFWEIVKVDLLSAGIKCTICMNLNW